MKAFKLLVAIISLTISANVYSQIEITINEGPKEMSLGEFNSFYTDIPEMDDKTFEKNLEKLLSEGNKSKLEKTKGEFHIHQAVSQRISQDPIDITAKYFETKEGLALYSFWEDEDGYISSETNPQKAEIIKKILVEFVTNLHKIVIQEELDEANNILSGLDKDLTIMMKAENKLHDEISGSEREIERIKRSIIENEGDQERHTDYIRNQKDKVHAMRDRTPEELDAAKGELKEYEKARNKLIKDHEGMHKEISKLEGKIRDAERDISRNLMDQDIKRGEISSQREVVQAIKMRLSAI